MVLWKATVRIWELSEINLRRIRSDQISLWVMSDSLWPHESQHSLVLFRLQITKIQLLELCSPGMASLEEKKHLPCLYTLPSTNNDTLQQLCPQKTSQKVKYICIIILNPSSRVTYHKKSSLNRIQWLIPVLKWLKMKVTEVQTRMVQTVKRKKAPSKSK